MPSILKDFYNGKLCPSERNLAHGQKAKSYMKLLEKQDAIVKRLEDSLDVQNSDAFKAYCELQMQLDAIEQEDLFLYAFRLGARLEHELFTPRTDGISAENF